MRYKHEFVYLLYSGDNLKIGRTWNIRVRMTALSREAGKRLKLMAFVPLLTTEECHKLETQLHSAIRGKSSRTEWHPFKPETVNLFFNQKGVVVCL